MLLFERGSAVGLAGWSNLKIAGHLRWNDVTFGDVRRNWLSMAKHSIKKTVIDLDERQNMRTERSSNKFSQPLIHCYQLFRV